MTRPCERLSVDASLPGALSRFADLTEVVVQGDRLVVSSEADHGLAAFPYAPPR
ncbi:hypothetical protein NGF19_25445 [Streptomyces sp. RY43-2]|uniref:Uncharacterized protein n=1 Tax=Streptomyces macrolidinus TaxID=2952607 RepID=A0ABT0ZKG0_9ACTN|nr:hypothetical protein [Streptomyces macrolidinus]MCN9244084.1 hypothetical protein [Streptomyces macrolidinus]